MMIPDFLLNAVQGVPPVVAVALLSAVPITEVQAAIPIGIGVYKLPVLTVYLASLVGNALPIPVVHLIMPPVLKWLETRFPKFHAFVERYFHALKHKHQATYDKWGALAIIILMALPFPGNGVWTTSVLSVLFGIHRKAAIPATLVGSVIASAVVLFATLGIIRIF